MSYASSLKSTTGYQLATIVPSFIRITVGTSAALTNQSLLDATVTAGDQAAPDHSANFNAKFVSACSSQLTSAPRLDVVSCGPIEVAPAGGSSGTTFTVHCGDAGAAVDGEDVSGLLPPQPVERESRIRHQIVRMSVIRSRQKLGVKSTPYGDRRRLRHASRSCQSRW